jgi:hypothetical protein
MPKPPLPFDFETGIEEKMGCSAIYVLEDEDGFWRSTGCWYKKD